MISLKEKYMEEVKFLITGCMKIEEKVWNKLLLRGGI